ncbi:hypothetical protein DRP43_03495 [candidate division TA06 bacterium]|uniref:Lipoprotein n=1 Tax=candidate division TA06 bacterium TaxID=2250710 RepID=A0A660SJQ4_UNCT6|nr:MAG: hypothetical protein DRP43_03495 [candidate division TA06 bacterium]
MKKKGIVFLAILIVLSFGCAKNVIIKKGPVLFNQIFKEGAILKYKITEMMTNTMVIQGNTQDQNMNMDFDISNEVERVKNDTVFLKTTIDKAEGTIRIQGAMKSIPDIDKLNGKSFSVTLLKNGKILNIEGDKELESQDTGSEIESYIRTLYGFLPDKQVNIGNTWERDYKEEGQSTHTIYTLTEFKQDKEEKEIAVITTKSEISVDKSIDQRGMKIKTEMSGTTKGKILFSIEDGFVSSAKIHTALEGKSYIEGSPMGNMEVPTYVNQDVEIKKIR